MPGDEGPVLRRESESRVSDEGGNRALNDPHPEVLAVNARAVQIHENGLGGRIEARLVEGIEGLRANGGAHGHQGLVGEDDQLDLAVTGAQDAPHPVRAHLEAAVGRGGEVLEVPQVLFGDQTQARSLARRAAHAHAPRTVRISTRVA